MAHWSDITQMYHFSVWVSLGVRLKGSSGAVKLPFSANFALYTTTGAPPFWMPFSKPEESGLPSSPSQSTILMN